MVTLQEIRTLTSEIMQDEGFDTNTITFYNQSINEAQKRIGELTKVLNGQKTYSSAVGKQEYTIPKDFMEFFEGGGLASNAVIYNDGTANKQARSVPYEFLLRFSDFRTKEATPQYYWVEERIFGFYPIPDIAGTNNITLSYIKYPKVMTSDLDASDFNDRWRYAIAYYTSSIMYEKNERFPDRDYYEKRALEEMMKITNSNYYIDNTRRTSSIGYIG